MKSAIKLSHLEGSLQHDQAQRIHMKQNILVTIIGHLLKSQNMCIRTISNYRSLISFIAAYNLQQSENTAQQMQQVNQELHSDLQTFTLHFQKLLGNMGQLPELAQPFGEQLHGLASEVDALALDSRAAVVHSPLLLNFALGRECELPDLIGALTQANARGELAAHQRQLRDALEQVQRLQQTQSAVSNQNFLLQSELQEQKQQKPQVVAESPGRDASLQMKVRKLEEKIALLDAENDLLRLNVQDLRDALQAAKGSDTGAAAVLQVLRESMEKDKLTIAELRNDNQKLQKQITSVQLSGADQAHMEAIQLGLRQIIQHCDDKNIQAETAADARAIQKNIALISTVVSQLASQFRSGQRALYESGEEIKKLQNIIVERDRFLQEYKDKKEAEANRINQSYSDEITKARADMSDAKQREIDDLTRKINKLVDTLREKESQIQVLHVQAQDTSGSKLLAEAKQGYSQVLRKIKEDLMKLYKKCNIEMRENMEFEISPLVERIDGLIIMERSYDQIVAKLQSLKESQGQLVARLKQYI